MKQKVAISESRGVKPLSSSPPQFNNLAEPVAMRSKGAIRRERADFSRFILSLMCLSFTYPSEPNPKHITPLYYKLRKSY
ncbi:hypothetical protein Dimus_039829 [Dionaea muscipula]